MTWPSGFNPATSPNRPEQVWAQAYHAGGGDYFRSGYYSFGTVGNGATTTGASALDVMYARPFLVPVRRAFDRIGVNCTTGGTGTIRFGIYADDGGQPGSLLLDAGTVTSTGTGAKEVTISQTLDPGVWWLATVAQGSAAPSLTFFTALFGAPPWFNTLTTPTPSVSCGVQTTASVSGSLPSSFTISTRGTSPVTCLRAA